MAIGEFIVGVGEVGVEDDHEFVRVLLGGGVEIELDKLVLEMSVYVLVGRTVYEFATHYIIRKYAC